MALTSNVGRTDRLARGVLGTVLLVAAALTFSSGSTAIAAVAGIAGVVLIVTAATQFCGLYAVLGMSTCPADRA
ncbi:YgaP family membrane protein [Salinarchaeum laminariae]|uniref:YgaP family membrane protein n=1 Tax=Salinarchaeum laminariae TaxID=869888 RepID=UPI0020BDA336|nr:DUF2892 domain-containing protein [Salinarchaeum laminariae]